MPSIVTWIFSLFLVSCTSGTEYESANNVTGKESAVAPGHEEENINDPLEADDEQQEREGGVDLLTAAVKDAIAALPGAELVEAEEVTVDGGRTIYEVEVRTNGETIEMNFDSQGRPIATEFPGNEIEDAEDEDGGEDED